jgi:hypothetical protein
MTEHAKPFSRIFLVAYDGGDPKPYAAAFSDWDDARAFAEQVNGHLVDTAVDQHVDLIGPEHRTAAPAVGRKRG